MPAFLHLADRQVREDLATYLGRAGRIEDGGLRLQQVSGAVAAWVPVLRPAGLLADSPLVMGVRGVPATLASTEREDLDGDTVDIVVPLRGMLDRLAREPQTDGEAVHLLLPAERMHESWTGVRPPLGGWERAGMLSSDTLIRVAEDGIAEVGERTGNGLGQVLAEQIRTATWTRELPAVARLRRVAKKNIQPDETLSQDEKLTALPPAGAAFAAHALGFLKPNELGQLATAPGWWRIAFPSGQVVVRRKNP